MLHVAGIDKSLALERKIESRKRNGNYQIFEIEREISLSTLDFSLESETLVNAWLRRQWSSSGEDSYI